jgi:hypothetical protein
VYFYVKYIENLENEEMDYSYLLVLIVPVRNTIYALLATTH